MRNHRRCSISKAKNSKKKYDQSYWKEVPISPELFPVRHESEIYENEKYSLIKEAKTVLNQLLCDRIYQLANQHFTEHQKKVLALLQLPDMTYNDIAEILSINYTGVSHAIKGIKSTRHDKYHGGFEKKMRKICKQDAECQILLRYIYELRNDDLVLALTVLKQYEPEEEIWQTLELDE